jgi:hypothetical protein
MTINWDEVQRELSPIKDYEDLCQRLHESFSFSFVCNTFNFSLPALINYTQKLLGGDSRGRYTEYASKLIRIFSELHAAGIQTVLDLKERTANREQLEIFTEQSKVSSMDTVAVLKFLIYWFIPGEKYLSGLIRDDPDINHAIKVLGELGIRTNLELLQKGNTTIGRKSLVEASGLPAGVISELVNRSDFSRMPWASKATISNIIGAGYGSLAQLAKADPEMLYADFFRYGKSIGKNLKLGNEIENSYRIAKIIPELMQKD